MALPPFLTSLFKKSPAAAPASMLDAAEVVREARSRARRRLIGASVLLGLGIIGLPLLFESRPRPIPVDLPIEIPAREGAPALNAPVARADARRPEARPAEPIDEPVLPASAASASAKPAAAKPSAPADTKPLTPPPVASTPAKPVAKPEVKPEAKPEVKPPVPPASKPEAKPPARPEPKPEAKPPAKPEAKVEPKPAAKPDAKTDTKPAAADEGRYVVQIGAFAEVGSAREARMKVEGMGLKTYTQVIDSATGRRIRVRVGPYATKAEADKAAARIKAGGLQAAVLVL
ncbi:SPOR domain-containing protein [Ideonella alba]|uniref:SPOR domain-containing protein n=1 Tax=Ideonella alba TaxID=2824118 RepID=A0A941BC44_9BURK|nr:SPOR domain-containing protein [Ideonella alba]MBQ0931545.1 SPOR domain-containing protein [Ideonella alba]